MSTLAGLLWAVVDVAIFAFHAAVVGLCWLVSPLVRLWYGWKERQ